MLQWLGDHRGMLSMLGASFLLGLLAFFIAMFVLVRMPADALEREPRGGSTAVRVGRNILGWLLILAGIAMLLLPGPGLIVLLLGIPLVDFPGKHQVQRWILSRKRIVGPINRLRKRFGRPPLQLNKHAPARRLPPVSERAA